jgi:hypothetical protein
MVSLPLTSSQEPEYVWELATLFPAQGEWSEEEYLDVTDGTNRRIELVDGRLEFLPIPTELPGDVCLAARLCHRCSVLIRG